MQKGQTRPSLESFNNKFDDDFFEIPYDKIVLPITERGVRILGPRHREPHPAFRGKYIPPDPQWYLHSAPALGKENWPATPVKKTPPVTPPNHKHDPLLNGPGLSPDSKPYTTPPRPTFKRSPSSVSPAVSELNPLSAPFTPRSMRNSSESP